MISQKKFSFSTVTVYTLVQLFRVTWVLTIMMFLINLPNSTNRIVAALLCIVSSTLLVYGYVQLTKLYIKISIVSPFIKEFNKDSFIVLCKSRMIKNRQNDTIIYSDLDTFDEIMGFNECDNNTFYI